MKLEVLEATEYQEHIVKGLRLRLNSFGREIEFDYRAKGLPFISLESSKLGMILLKSPSQSRSAACVSEIALIHNEQTTQSKVLKTVMIKSQNYQVDDFFEGGTPLHSISIDHKRDNKALFDIEDEDRIH